MVLCFFNETATTEIYPYCHTLSLHDALPIYNREHAPRHGIVERTGGQRERSECGVGEATFVDDAREHRESGERDARAHEQSRAALTQSFGEEARSEARSVGKE